MMGNTPTLNTNSYLKSHTIIINSCNCFRYDVTRICFKN